MPSQLSVSKELIDNVWVITASVVDGGILPSNIFVYENTGSATLGSFYGTANVADLSRLQVWAGSAIPQFGNKFVLSDEAKIYVSQGATADSVIAALVANVKLLSTELQTVNTSTQIIDIP